MPTMTWRWPPKRVPDDPLQEAGPARASITFRIPAVEGPLGLCEQPLPDG
jgi:hypothetical protein